VTDSPDEFVTQCHDDCIRAFAKLCLDAWKGENLPLLADPAKRTTKCETCHYRGIDGGPSPFMVCNHTDAPMQGSIVHWEDMERVSYQCPMKKEECQ